METKFNKHFQFLKKVLARAWQGLLDFCLKSRCSEEEMKMFWWISFDVVNDQTCCLWKHAWCAFSIQRPLKKSARHSRDNQTETQPRCHLYCRRVLLEQVTDKAFLSHYHQWHNHDNWSNQLISFDHILRHSLAMALHVWNEKERETVNWPPRRFLLLTYDITCCWCSSAAGPHHFLSLQSHPASCIHQSGKNLQSIISNYNTPPNSKHRLVRQNLSRYRISVFKAAKFALIKAIKHIQTRTFFFFLSLQHLWKNHYF